MSAVAVFLMAAEQDVRAFRLLILRDHVVLTTATAAPHGFEMLDGGRGLGSDELAELRARHAAYLVELPADQFLAPYLDNLASRLTIEGRAREATSMHRRAIDASTFGRFRFNYATTLLFLDEPRTALRELDRAARDGFDVVETRLQRGVAYWRLGRLRKALSASREALVLDPTNEAAILQIRSIEALLASGTSRQRR